MLPAVATPDVVAIARRFEQNTRGVVTFRLHRVFDVHAGPSSRHDDVVFDGIYENGTLVKMRIVSYTIGGKPADAQQRADFEQQWVHTDPKLIFHPPYDPRYVNEYRYRTTGNRQIEFTPLSPDAAHGSGVFTYDRQLDVTSNAYTPSVMPQYATSGSIADFRAAVLPNYWAVTRETQQYKGHYALWSGGATVEVTWTNFHRYASVEQAAENVTRNP